MNLHVFIVSHNFIYSKLQLYCYLAEPIFQCTLLNKKSRQLSTFPLKSSIIDVRELDFRVRNGNGYCLSTMATGIYKQFNQKESGKSYLLEHRDGKNVSHSKENFNGKNGKDNMVKPHDLLVMLG